MSFMTVFLFSFCQFSFCPDLEYDFVPSWVNRLCPDKRKLQIMTSLVLLPKIIEGNDSLFDLVVVFSIRVWLILLFSTAHLYSKKELVAPLLVAGSIQIAVGHWSIVLFIFVLLLFSYKAKRYHKPSPVPRLDAAMRFRG